MTKNNDQTTIYNIHIDQPSDASTVHLFVRSDDAMLLVWLIQMKIYESTNLRLHSVHTQ